MPEGRRLKRPRPKFAVTPKKKKKNLKSTENWKCRKEVCSVL
jgi:hypothetical protein